MTIIIVTLVTVDCLNNFLITLESPVYLLFNALLK